MNHRGLWYDGPLKHSTANIMCLCYNICYSIMNINVCLCTTDILAAIYLYWMACNIAWFGIAWLWTANFATIPCFNRFLPFFAIWKPSGRWRVTYLNVGYALTCISFVQCDSSGWGWIGAPGVRHGVKQRCMALGFGKAHLALRWETLSYIVLFPCFPMTAELSVQNVCWHVNHTLHWWRYSRYSIVFTIVHK